MVSIINNRNKICDTFHTQDALMPSFNYDDLINALDNVDEPLTKEKMQKVMREMVAEAVKMAWDRYSYAEKDLLRVLERRGGDGC